MILLSFLDSDGELYKVEVSRGIATKIKTAGVVHFKGKLWYIHDMDSDNWIVFSIAGSHIYDLDFAS